MRPGGNMLRREPGDVPELSAAEAVSSQRRTFSPAELAGERVITRCITPSWGRRDGFEAVRKVAREFRP
jgi:hypothetical protein